MCEGLYVPLTTELFVQGFGWGAERFSSTQGTLAFTTVSLFSLYMKISWTGAAACQFTLYMALGNGSCALGAGLNRLNSWIDFWAHAGVGFLEDIELAPPDFYLVAAFMALVPLATLPFIDVKNMEERKQNDMLVAIPPSSSALEG